VVLRCALRDEAMTRCAKQRLSGRRRRLELTEGRVQIDASKNKCEPADPARRAMRDGRRALR
jgi:hypothetical protein